MLIMLLKRICDDEDGHDDDDDDGDDDDDDDGDGDDDDDDDDSRLLAPLMQGSSASRLQTCHHRRRRAQASLVITQPWFDGFPLVFASGNRQPRSPQALEGLPKSAQEGRVGLRSVQTLLFRPRQQIKKRLNLNSKH